MKAFFKKVEQNKNQLLEDYEMKSIVRGKVKITKHGGTQGKIHFRVKIKCQSPEQSLLPEMERLAVPCSRSYNIYQSN
jgi:hypothetical protein